MTESSALGNVTHFTLGQEMPPLGFTSAASSSSSADEMEEEPVSKRLKFDDESRGETGTSITAPATDSTSTTTSMKFELPPLDAGTVPSDTTTGQACAVTEPVKSEAIPAPTSGDPKPELPLSKTEGGSVENPGDFKTSTIPASENPPASESTPVQTTEKAAKKEKRRKRRKSKHEESGGGGGSGTDDGDTDGETNNDDSGSGEKKKKKKGKGAHLRKNIREIMSTTQLDEETLAAQREEQERRARMTAKLQQQQQQNLLEMLNAKLPTTPFDGAADHQIDKLLARKGVSSAPGLISLKSLQAGNKRVSTPSVIDEVTLSSDEESPDIIPLLDDSSSGLMEPFNFNGFRSSGGTVLAAVEDRGHEEDTGVDDGIESDSDDCVVLSPSEYHEEADKEGKEDDNNFPDELGRVLVNVAHPAEDPDIFLAPQIARAVKPHQIGGIRFLYDNVVESLERFNTSNGFGCILAHSMGLGKTIQAISFCDIFLRHTRATKVLIIVPINTLQNWVNEFDIWTPPDPASVSSYGKLFERKGSMKGKVGRKPKNFKSPADSFDNSSTNDMPPPSPVLPPPNPPTPQSMGEGDSSETSRESSGGDIRPRNFQVYVLSETVKTLASRERIISEWHFNGGVLLLGYEMYRMLALKRLKRSSKKKLANRCLTEEGLQSQRMEEESLERIYEYLVKPGPDLVVCDEGHRIKNSGASISQALKAVGTKRRVVLTGYPLQNNLMEYWCMVDFVRPNYLGSKTEFSNMFERPITNGQCVDSSVQDKRLMRYRSHVLHTLLEGFVQRRSHLVLQSALPFKEEWVFLLKMTPIQFTLYKEFISYLREEHRDRNADRDGSPTANPIKAFAVCCKIWNHPDALYNVVKKHRDVLEDLDMEDMDGPQEEGSSKKPGRKPRRNLIKPPATNLPDPFSGAPFSPDLLGGGLGVASMANIPSTVAQVSSTSGGSTSDGRSIKLEWATPLFKSYEAEVLENGVKFQVLFAILEEVQTVGDRLLVFSQSLLTLDLIELFLSKRFGWRRNAEYFRLDGSTSAMEREKLITDFNGREGVHLFLVSTRAGSLGINLIGANRVVVLDASWNPCHDAQAVCRVYRYGQRKECQIYRFVTDCSLEKRIYDRQINKRGMADRVVDEMNPETFLNTKDVSSFLVLDEGEMEEAQKSDITQSFNMSKFTDPVLRNVLLRCGNRLTREPFEHESLLIDRKETKLSAKEKRQAHQNYEMEKKQAAQPGLGYTYNRPSYAAYYPKPDPGGVPLLPSSLSYPNYNNNSISNSFSSEPHRTSISSSSASAYGKSLTFREKMYEQIQHRRQEERDLPYTMLKERGIDCRFMILKKDAYLQDPSGGPEIFLRSGEKINIFRSTQGTYIRAAASGRIIAIKPTGNSNLFRGIPLTGEVSSDQLQSLVYSLLKPAPKRPTYYNPYVHPRNSHQSSTEIPGWRRSSTSSSYESSNKPPPSMQKLPPTSGIFPSFHNLHHVSNLRGSSGGDVSILRKNPGKKLSSYSPRNQSSSSGSDIEVIEFEEHFGETRTQQKRVEENMKKLAESVGRSGSSLVSRKDGRKGGTHHHHRDPRAELSITPVPPKNQFPSILDLKSPEAGSSSSSSTNTTSAGSGLKARQQNLMQRPPLTSSTSSTNNNNPRVMGSNDNSSSSSNVSWDLGSSGSDLSTGNHHQTAEETLESLLWNNDDLCVEKSGEREGGGDLPLPVTNLNISNSGSSLDNVPAPQAIPPWGMSPVERAPPAAHNNPPPMPFLADPNFPGSSNPNSYHPNLALQNLIQNFSNTVNNGVLGNNSGNSFVPNFPFAKPDMVNFPPNSDLYGHYFEDILGNKSADSRGFLRDNDFLGAVPLQNNTSSRLQFHNNNNNSSSSSNNNNGSSNINTGNNNGNSFQNLNFMPGQYYGGGGGGGNCGGDLGSNSNNSDGNSFNLFQ